VVSRHPIWELVFLMLVLKIPIAYLCGIVTYAIRAVPDPEEGAEAADRLGSDDPGPGWSPRRPRRGRPRPHGGPTRTYARSPRPALSHTQARRR
jgi:hypothetical protein